MSFPETPCEGCPRVARGLPLPCKAQLRKAARYCELVAMGRQDYVELLCEHFEPAPAPLPMPSLLKRAANLAGAVVQHLAAGMPEVTEAGFNARMAVCRGCEMLRPGDVCGHQGCGCFLQIKAHWADQACPLGKWPC